MLIGFFIISRLEAKGNVVVALSSAPNNLSPFFATDANSQNLNKLIHVSLLDFNQSMQFECHACESYSESVLEGKHVFKFKLKPNLTFSNGDKLVAQDVYQSFLYFVRDEKINSTFKGAFESIESIEVLNDLEFKLVFKGFSLENFSNLILFKIVKIKESNHSDLDPIKVLGAGEYVLTKVEPLEVILTPRTLGKPNLTFKVVKDETTLALKLINKEVDLSVATMSPRKIDWLKKQGEIKTWEEKSGNFIFMGPNFQNQFLAEEKFRKALSMLIPREDILKYKLKSTATLSNGMFSAAFKDVHEDKSLPDSYNPRGAETLLKSLGLNKKSDGYFYKNDQKVLLQWKVNNNKSSIEIVEVIKSYFEKAGIAIEMSILEWGTFMSQYKAGKYDLVLGQWIGFTGPDMLRFVFHTENMPPKGGNRIRMSDIEFDHLIDFATVQTNEKLRKDAYQKAYQYINSKMPYINLWHPNTIWIGSRCLQNIVLNPSGNFKSLANLEFNCGK